MNAGLAFAIGLLTGYGAGLKTWRYRTRRNYVDMDINLKGPQFRDVDIEALAENIRAWQKKQHSA